MGLYEGYSATNRPLVVTILALAYRAKRDEPFDEWSVRLSDAPQGVETEYAVLRVDRSNRNDFTAAKDARILFTIPERVPVHWLDGRDAPRREIIVEKLTYWHREPDTDAYVVEALTASGQSIEFAVLITDTKLVVELQLSRDTGESVSILERVGIPVEDIYGKPDQSLTDRRD